MFHKFHFDFLLACSARSGERESTWQDCPHAEFKLWEQKMKIQNHYIHKQTASDFNSEGLKVLPLMWVFIYGEYLIIGIFANATTVYMATYQAESHLEFSLAQEWSHFHLLPDPTKEPQCPSSHSQGSSPKNNISRAALCCLGGNQESPLVPTEILSRIQASIILSKLKSNLSTCIFLKNFFKG